MMRSNALICTPDMDVERIAAGHALGAGGMLCLLMADSFLKRRRPWFISLSDKALTKVPSPAGVVGRSLKLQARARHK
jgi:hypothetical protein